jgi:hypothetical protein
VLQYQSTTNSPSCLKLFTFQKQKNNIALCRTDHMLQSTIRKHEYMKVLKSYWFSKWRKVQLNGLAVRYSISEILEHEDSIMLYIMRLTQVLIQFQNKFESKYCMVFANKKHVLF